MGSVESRKCPECGASVAEGVRRCAYCGVWLETDPAPAADISSAAGPASGRTEPLQQILPGVAEFGLRGRAPLVAGALVAVLLYTIGWVLEDKYYWLADEAVAIWGVELPAWLFLVALAWRSRWGGWMVGFAVAVPLFAIHLGTMWIIEGRLNDDYVGISALYAGAALGGWLAGRIVHAAVRRARARGDY